jgi:hypothetical protein
MLCVRRPFSVSSLELFQSSVPWCGRFLGFRFAPPQAIIQARLGARPQSQTFLIFAPFKADPMLTPNFTTRKFSRGFSKHRLFTRCLLAVFMLSFTSWDNDYTREQLPPLVDGRALEFGAFTLNQDIRHEKNRYLYLFPRGRTD